MVRTLQPQPNAPSVSGTEDEPEVRLQVDQRLRGFFEGSAARIRSTRLANTQQPARAVPTEFALELVKPEVPRSSAASTHAPTDAHHQPHGREAAISLDTAQATMAPAATTRIEPMTRARKALRFTGKTTEGALLREGAFTGETAGTAD